MKNISQSRKNDYGVHYDSVTKQLVVYLPDTAKKPVKDKRSGMLIQPTKRVLLDIGGGITKTTL